MNVRRATVAGVVVVAVAGGVGWGLFGYDPTGPPPDAPFQRREPNGSFQGSISLTTGGSAVLNYTVQVDDVDGEQLVRQEFPNATYVTYWTGNRSFTRVDANREAEYRRFLDAEDDERILWRDDRTMAGVSTTNDAAAPLAGQQLPQALLAAVLGYGNSRRVGTATYDGERVADYRPRGGWFEAPGIAGTGGHVRVTNASGYLYVDPETGTLYRADVSYDYVKAGTWGDYLVSTVVEGEGTTVTVDYAYDPGPVNVTEPSWVGERSFPRRVPMGPG